MRDIYGQSKVCSICNRKKSTRAFPKKDAVFNRRKSRCKYCEFKLKNIQIDNGIEDIYLSYETFRQLILKRDSHTCHYCKETGTTIDHKKPLSKGGLTSLENCVCSCDECNKLNKDIGYLEFVDSFC